MKRSLRHAEGLISLLLYLTSNEKSMNFLKLNLKFRNNPTPQQFDICFSRFWKFGIVCHHATSFQQKTIF
jgi:hypothetical protein